MKLATLTSLCIAAAFAAPAQEQMALIETATTCISIYDQCAKGNANEWNKAAW